MSYDNIFTHPTSVTIFAPNHCYIINATQGNSVHTLGTLKAKSFLALIAEKVSWPLLVQNGVACFRFRVFPNWSDPTGWNVGQSCCLGSVCVWRLEPGNHWELNWRQGGRGRRGKAGQARGHRGQQSTPFPLFFSCPRLLARPGYMPSTRKILRLRFLCRCIS